MIKVNYNPETTRVISFGKDTKPYIEITEEQRKQPLPDKYSYYAVIDGKFTIARRTPTEQEIAKDLDSARNQQISELKAKLKETDYKAIKFAEGWISAEEYAPIKEQRNLWRAQINELEGANGNSENQKYTYW